MACTITSQNVCIEKTFNGKMKIFHDDSLAKIINSLALVIHKKYSPTTYIAL